MKIYLLLCILMTSVTSSLIQADDQVSDSYLIVVDAGHGGVDRGADGDEVTEREVVTAVANKLKGTYKNYEVVFHNPEDKLFSLSDRAQAINKLQPDLVITLHTAVGKPSKPYFSHMYVPADGEYSDVSNQVALGLSASLNKHTKFKSTNISDARHFILKNVKAPIVMVELGSISEKKDMDYLLNDSGLKRISTAFNSYFSTLKK